MYSDNLIRRMVEGYLKKYKIYISPIIILRIPNKTILRFIVFQPRPRRNWVKDLPKNTDVLVVRRPPLTYLMNYLKSLLSQRWTDNFSLQIIRVPHPSFNVKLLSDFLAQKIFESPYNAYRYMRNSLKFYRRRYFGYHRYFRKGVSLYRFQYQSKDLKKYYIIRSIKRKRGQKTW